MSNTPDSNRKEKERDENFLKCNARKIFLLMSGKVLQGLFDL